MKRSKIGISLLLIFAVILTACSGQTKTIGKYDEAYASHKPEETVLFIEGKPICWEEFFYHIVYYITYLENSFGEVTDWSAPLYGNTSCQQFVCNGAVEWLTFDAALDKAASSAHCLIDEEDESALAAEWESLVQTYPSENALLEEMQSYYCSKEIYQRMLKNTLLSEKYFESLFGVNGCDLTDEEVGAYTAYDGYLMAKQIFIGKQSDGDTTVGLELAQFLAGQLKMVPEEQREQRFAELVVEYSGDGAAAFYDSTLFAFSDVGEEIYDGTLAIPEYGVSGVLETEDGFHVMLRVPVDFDAVSIAYSDMDVAEAGQYSLRSLTAHAMYEERLMGDAGEISVEYTDLFNTIDFNILFH